VGLSEFFGPFAPQILGLHAYISNHFRRYQSASTACVKTKGTKLVFGGDWVLFVILQWKFLFFDLEGAGGATFGRKSGQRFAD
jgi:hypothetical protein